MNLAFDVEAARVTDPSAYEDAPQQESMRAQQGIRRNPAPEDLKVRRDPRGKSAHLASAEAREVVNATSGSDPMNTNRREADLLEAMAKATPGEQRVLMAELDQLQANRRQARADERSLDWGAEVVADHLTPAPTFERHTAATDWLDAVAPHATPDMEHRAAAEAAVWVTDRQDAVLVDANEFKAQASGVAQVFSSQYGEGAPIAREAFLSEAYRLRNLKVGNSEGIESWETTHTNDDDDQNGNADSALPLEVTPSGAPEEQDNFAPPVDPVNSGTTTIDGYHPPMPGAGEKTSARKTAARSLYEIAQEIKADWGANVNYAAAPYLDAMMQLDSMSDSYGADDAEMIVAYFLSNARSWTGDKAREIKKELKGMSRYGSKTAADEDGTECKNCGKVVHKVGDEWVDSDGSALCGSEGDTAHTASVRRHAGESQTCSVCGDSIAKDPAGENPSTYHHTNGTSHDHEAKPGSESKESSRREAFNTEGSATWDQKIDVVARRVLDIPVAQLPPINVKAAKERGDEPTPRLLASLLDEAGHNDAADEAWRFVAAAPKQADMVLFTDSLDPITDGEDQIAGSNVTGEGEVVTPDGANDVANVKTPGSSEGDYPQPKKTSGFGDESYKSHAGDAEDLFRPDDSTPPYTSPWAEDDKKNDDDAEKKEGSLNTGSGFSEWNW